MDASTTFSAAGEALYDQLMQSIEPDLTAEGLLTLEKKYEGETKEAAKIRAARYNKSFEAFDKKLNDLGTGWTQGMKKAHRQAFASLEKENVGDEQSVLTTLEQTINSSL